MTPRRADAGGGRILDTDDYRAEVARLRAALEEIADRRPATMEGAMLAVRAREALADPFPCTPIRDELAAAGFRLVEPGDETLVREYNLDTWEMWAHPHATPPIHLVFPRAGGRYYSEAEWWRCERRVRDYLREMREDAGPRATEEAP